MVFDLISPILALMGGYNTLAELHAVLKRPKGMNSSSPSLH